MTFNILNLVVAHPREWEGWIAENVKLFLMLENKSCTRWSISLIHQVTSQSLPVILGSLITTTWPFSTALIFLFSEISQILQWMCLSWNFCCTETSSYKFFSNSQGILFFTFLYMCLDGNLNFLNGVSMFSVTIFFIPLHQCQLILKNW